MKTSIYIKKTLSVLLLSTAIGVFSQVALAKESQVINSKEDSAVKVTLNDLGEFKLSVKKFTSMKALDAHHEHLLDEANNGLTPLNWTKSSKRNWF